MVLLLLLLLLLLFQLFILLLFTSGEPHRAESRHQTVVFIFFPVVGDVNVSQHFHDLLEFRSGVHISLPGILDGMREDRVTTLRDGWTHASLDDI